MPNPRCSLLSHILLVLLVGLLMSAPVRATSYGTDASDLWGNPDESGWGIQFVQQDGVIFATMYVYDQAGNPTWYIATLTDTGNSVWSGDLLMTHGPWFGGQTFNPSTATVRKVGTMTFAFQYVQSGTLVYSVDGVTVSKAIQRTTFRLDDYNGHYLGAYRSTATGCSYPAFNGTQIYATSIAVTQGQGSVKVTISGGAAGTCVFNGNSSQSGQFGHSSGTYSCSTGEMGTYTFFEMAISWYSLRGRLSATNNFGCSLTGTFAALRDQ